MILDTCTDVGWAWFTLHYAVTEKKKETWKKENKQKGEGKGKKDKDNTHIQLHLVISKFKTVCRNYELTCSMLWKLYQSSK